MKAATQQTARGPVLSISTDDGRTGTAFVPNTVTTGPLATPMTNLANALNAFAGVVTANSQRFQPAALVEHNLAAVANVLAKPFQTLQSAAQDETRNLAATRARSLVVDPETPANAPVRARTLKVWDAADIAGKASIVTNASYEKLAGLIVSGALDDVPADLATIAQDRYAAFRLVNISGIQSDHALQPSSQDPIAGAPDVAAATAVAAQALKDMKARAETIDDVRSSLQSVVTVAAITTDLPIEVAFNLLANGKLPA
jgi:hypothetical protein